MKINLLLVLFISGSIFAQDRTTASGGDANSASGSISYSVGLIDYIEISGMNGSVYQGVQQPYELFSVGIPEWGQNFTISAFPNPATHQLTLTFEEEPDPKTNFEFTDETGRLVLSGDITSKTTTVDLGSLAVATYFLNITSSERVIRTYKIIKNH